jgi:hypothetical protein
MSFQIDDDKFITEENIETYFNEWNSIEKLGLTSKQLAEKKRQRGYYFEKIIYSLLVYSNLEPSTSFRPDGEEIDGSFFWNNFTFLLEAKWHKKEIEASKVYSFKGKVEGKFHLTSGVFISMSNYSTDCEAAVRYGKSQDVLFFTKEDVEDMIMHKVRFSDILKFKFQEASLSGVINISYRSKNEFKRALDSLSFVSGATQSQVIVYTEPNLLVISFDQILLEKGIQLIKGLKISDRFNISSMTYISNSADSYNLNGLKNFTQYIQRKENCHVIFVYPDSVDYIYTNEDVSDFRDFLDQAKTGFEFLPITLGNEMTEFSDDEKEMIENFLINIVNPNRLF